MTESNANRLVGEYADMILRISFMYLKDVYDAEDICQEVFLKLLSSERTFTSTEHEKAWIIRTSINACKDRLKKAFYRKSVSLEEARDIAAPGETTGEMLEMLKRLPKSYRICLYLYYYEGYRAAEIGELIGRSENAVNACISRGRKRLKALLTSDGYCVPQKGEHAYAK